MEAAQEEPGVKVRFTLSTKAPPLLAQTAPHSAQPYLPSLSSGRFMLRWLAVPEEHSHLLPQVLRRQARRTGDLGGPRTPLKKRLVRQTLSRVPKRGFSDDICDTFLLFFLPTLLPAVPDKNRHALWSED